MNKEWELQVETPLRKRALQGGDGMTPQRRRAPLEEGEMTLMRVNKVQDVDMIHPPMMRTETR